MSSPSFRLSRHGLSVAWNKDMVATYKDGLDNRGEVYDFERGEPAGTAYWLTDDSIARSSWCCTMGLGHYSTTAMLHSLVDRVSTGDTMVFNLAPIADRTIRSGQQTFVRGIGDRLKRFRESIDATRARLVFGKGPFGRSPTQTGGGSLTTPREGTNREPRFAHSKDDTVLYATMLGWPGSTLTITTALPARQYSLVAEPGQPM